MVPGHLRSTRATRPAHTHRLPGACVPATQESAMMKAGRPPTTSANIHTTPLYIYDAKTTATKKRCRRWRLFIRVKTKFLPQAEIPAPQKTIECF
jgi:hypothetical protein